MKYRPEIDGLRAIAVIPVVLFHAGFDLFSGGFVGVDVFFVISGYLITTILIDEIENKKFSIIDFYERRARRILPALFLVVLACVPFAWLWMQPRQMNDFFQSIVAVSVFASNILFWQENDYFAPAAEEKPLLHTWSLAVEEQYYLLFPIVLLFVWRFGKSKASWAIVFLSVISFALCEWGSRAEPTANFYLAPTRAWELFAGSLAAFVVQKRGVQNKGLLSTAGLLAVVFGVFAYDKTTPFPSAYTLVPVLGVVLLIIFSGKDTVTTKLLSNRALVGIGLISYSFYLWHQPLFAFARIQSLEEPTGELMGLLALLALGLAFGTWKYLEKPFRNHCVVGKRGLFSFSLAMLTLFAGFGLFSLSYNLANKRPTLYEDSIVEREKQRRFHAKQEICNLKTWEKCNEPEKGKVNVLVIGDSHAADALNALYHATEGNREGISFSTSDLGGCGPHLNTEETLPNTWPNKKRCVQLNKDERFNQEFLNKYDVVVISFLLSGKTTAETLVSYLDYLQGAYKGKLIVFGGAFAFNKELPVFLNRGYNFEDVGLILKFSPSQSDGLLRKHAADAGALFLSKFDVFCPESKCNFALEGALMTYDKHHLSVDFANMLGERYREVLKRLLADRAG